MARPLQAEGQGEEVQVVLQLLVLVWPAARQRYVAQYVVRPALLSWMSG